VGSVNDQWYDFFWLLPTVKGPEALALGIFSAQHLAVLAGLAVAIVATVWAYKRASTHGRKVMRLAIGIAVLVMEGFRQIAFISLHAYKPEILPLHLCAVVTFCVFIDSVRPNSWTREVMYALGTWGPACALAFPDWATQPLFNIHTWQAFLIHGCLLAYSFMLLVSRELRPNVRQLWKVGVIVGVFVAVSLVANHAWGTNFWFLNVGSPGSPLQPLQDATGALYLPTLAVLVAILWTAMYLPWVLSDRRHPGRRQALA